MRRLLLFVTAGTIAALAVIAPAAAKGPTTAALTGPGLDHPIPVRGEGEIGTDTPLGSLVQLGGFFPQMFVEAPDPTTRARPAADLGPRYRVMYRVPGPNGISTVVQDVYPYAKTPVTYMSSGQRFWGDQRTHGGWVVTGAGLKATLVGAGLPESPPASDGSFPWAWTGAGALAAVLLLVFVLRRRSVVRFRMLRTTA
jgi:hypothetical protein